MSSTLAIRSERAVLQLEFLKSQLSSSNIHLIRLRQDTNDLSGVSQWVIQKIVLLKESFEKTTLVENRKHVLLDSERLLLQIRQGQNEFCCFISLMYYLFTKF